MQVLPASEILRLEQELKELVPQELQAQGPPASVLLLVQRGEPQLASGLTRPVA